MGSGGHFRIGFVAPTWTGMVSIDTWPAPAAELPVVTSTTAAPGPAYSFPALTVSAFLPAAATETPASGEAVTRSGKVIVTGPPAGSTT
jgi:hypothetical protein